MTISILLAEAKKNLPELVVALKRYVELLNRKGDQAERQSYAAGVRDLGRQIGYRI